ncbi:hypothetical protein [Cereibacter changlensis]|uniref:Major facilitator superfamily (MFS) profile domain-containing protein n=2 Tax=Cereibacter changlensis TaxID=402884 RepID=A0A2T4K095_9RHOB|nr:hypothetical protein [Cereibacter changlensis]PTE23569.1 hypothetical protein C5F48_01635 [Cereibacter changlensis JA139]PZX58512.1 hypothetical protein LX76_00012 [Cereibacter changlensis]
MAFGIAFAGILSGFSLAIWALLQGHSFPVVLLAYSVAGTIGAVLFIVFALIRTEQRSPPVHDGAGQQAR